MMKDSRTRIQLDHLLHPLGNITKPARYIGGEPNQAAKEELLKKPFRAVLCYPDLYEVGMSYLGLHILLEASKRAGNWAMERVFMPSPEMCSRLREQDVPLFSLETRRPLKQADLIGFTLQTETTYTNIVEILELSRIPVFAEDRSNGHPLVIAGGTGAFHPEPVAPFFDLILPGDGEDSLPLLLEMLEELEGMDRKERLLALAREFPWVYVPSFYFPESGKPEPCMAGIPMPVRPALLKDLASAPYPLAPIVPWVESIHERVSVEIMRGCVNSCRFCEAGMTRRPLRFRRRNTIVRIAKESVESTGYDEVSLMSLSSTDHPDLEGIMDDLHRELSSMNVSIPLSSLRVDKDLLWLPEKVKRIRKSSLTLAPEAGTERLRMVINKPVSGEDLIRGAEKAWLNGWTRLKLYFMIGLPTETDEDVEGIVRLSEEVSKARIPHKKGPGLVSVTVSTFVPRPWTPFQWERMTELKEIREKQRMLKSLLKLGSVKLKFHHPERSFLEAVLGRGSRKVGKAIREAMRLGAHMDGWDEYFDWGTWLRAFEKVSVDPETEGLSAIPLERELPWDHISFGLKKQWLLAEREKAYRGETTPSCLHGPCSSCGLDPMLCRELRTVERDPGK